MKTQSLLNFVEHFESLGFNAPPKLADKINAIRSSHGLSSQGINYRQRSDIADKLARHMKHTHKLPIPDLSTLGSKDE